ncbi:MAG TPA: hypothetical protein VF748_16010 [Candidatus Acidoferrum sp.]
MATAPGSIIHSKKTRQKKDRQLNVRFTKSELETLQEIARMEDRDLSYVVSFFVYQGVQLYSQVGSLMTLRSLKFGFRKKTTQDSKDILDGLKVAAGSRNK